MKCLSHGPVAQLVRAPPCHGGGREFESLLGRMWGLSSAGRASALQAEGHRFEPYRPHFFNLICRSGGTGRRPGLKIPWVVIPVPVRFRSTAAFGTEPDWFCSFFVNSVANFVSSCHNNCKRSRLPAKPESASFICSFISFYASAAFSSCSFSLASSSPSSTKRDGSTG